MNRRSPDETAARRGRQPRGSRPVRDPGPARLRRHHARNGEEALQALVPDGDCFGVVLLDLGLPDQDGYEVCGKIRKLTGTPVIMVTARSDVRSRIHGLNLGADDYVVKPYDTGELLARIHAVSRRTVHEDATGSTETWCAWEPCASSCRPGRSAWTVRPSS